MTPPTPSRVLVVGFTASGKTTVATRLAAHFSLPLVHLDALHWGPNWIARESWVMEGSYLAIAETAWSRADLVIWLDLPFIQLLSQQMRRSFRRAWHKEDLFGGNRESLRTYFFSRDSLFLWLVKEYRRRQQAYSEIAQRHGTVPLVHLRSRRHVDQWLKSFADEPATGVH
jgi:adenylate kinase family enzyme